jgi:uncharacterized protein YcnI
VSRLRRFRRGVVALLVSVAAGAFAPAVAGAHIQVIPSIVAPNDPVKFTVVVPGEQEDSTTSVDLKMPTGLLPFSYEETPGWTRKLVLASNGAVDRVVWTGKLPKDGFVEFSFLAGTPEKPGELVFKALQTYADNSVVRWIGEPKSDHPAPVVEVQKDAPRQNAGGESGSDGGGDAQPAAAASATATPTTAAVETAAVVSSGSDRDPLAIALGGGGLLLGLIALGVSLSGRRGSPSRDRASERG